VLVVGTGLIGTSIGLALSRAGVTVLVHDEDPEALTTALRRGAGLPWGDEGRYQTVDHVVLAVPPAAVAPALKTWQRLALDTTFSDVASVKSEPLQDAEDLGCDMATWVGGHPFAGRERGGPAAADAELFVGRPWALCPSPRTGEEALGRARQVVLACGGRPTVTSPERHDAAAAALSHVPQLVASALAAASLLVEDTDLRLVGPGFLDTTRLADSSPLLWAEVVAANAGPVHRCLGEVLRRLEGLHSVLGTSVLGTGVLGAAREQREDPPDAGGVAAATYQLVAEGNAARRRLPDKSAEGGARWERVVAVVEDRPGELARLLLAAATAGVNVEDVRVEHTPDAGLADLDVVAGAAGPLVQVLRSQGWRCHLDPG